MDKTSDFVLIFYLFLRGGSTSYYIPFFVQIVSISVIKNMVRDIALYILKIIFLNGDCVMAVKYW